MQLSEMHGVGRVKLFPINLIYTMIYNIVILQKETLSDFQYIKWVIERNHRPKLGIFRCKRGEDETSTGYCFKTLSLSNVDLKKRDKNEKPRTKCFLSKIFNRGLSQVQLIKFPEANALIFKN